MPYEIMDHTADLRIRVTAGSLSELFEESLRALMEILSKEAMIGKPSSVRRIAIEAPDVTILLIDFLSEALTLCHIYKERYSIRQWKRLNPQSLEVEIEGFLTHVFQEDMKSVTYHEAEVHENKKGQWETLIVFDI